MESPLVTRSVPFKDYLLFLELFRLLNWYFAEDKVQE